MFLVLGWKYLLINSYFMHCFFVDFVRNRFDKFTYLGLCDRTCNDVIVTVLVVTSGVVGLHHSRSLFESSVYHTILVVGVLYFLNIWIFVCGYLIYF